MERLIGVAGIGALLLIAFLLSSNRKAISWRIVGFGLALEVLMAYLLLNFAPVVAVFEVVATGVTKVISFADEGTAFLFGKVSNPAGPWGFLFAVKVLPIIIFFASLMGVLYHLGVMQRIVAGIAWVLRRTLKVTGVEALSTAANIFAGQTEAPLTVKPYIARMTQSQLMCIMVGGFANIAGSVLAAYVMMLGGESKESQILFAKHLMAASVMSAPGAIIMAKIMVPETETPPDESRETLLKEERSTRNVMDAAASGATDGLHLALNVAAMLVAFVALLAMVNWPLEAFSRWEPIAAWRETNGLPVFRLENILGLVFRPIAWLIGVPWSESGIVGGLMGTQIIATEFIAYDQLARLIPGGEISPRSAQIAAYALCGFSNVPSIAIQIGGLSAMAPSRRADLAALGPKAMFAGALSCWLGGAVASLFIA
jgi:CNT family concentrative nucleoside transporter